MHSSSNDHDRPHDSRTPTPQTNVVLSPHIARGNGLHEATTGAPTFLTIELVQDDGEDTKWTPHGGRFIYVWIASEDQVTSSNNQNVRP